MADYSIALYYLMVVALCPAIGESQKTAEFSFLNLPVY